MFYVHLLIHFVSPSVDDIFHFLAVMNCTAKNMHVQFLCDDVFSCLYLMPPFELPCSCIFVLHFLELGFFFHPTYRALVLPLFPVSCSLKIESTLE